MNVAIQPLRTAGGELRCPRCANTHGIKDGGPSLQGHRAYDIFHDTYGLMRCPHCGFRGGSAEFQRGPAKQTNS